VLADGGRAMLEEILNYEVGTNGDGSERDTLSQLSVDWPGAVSVTEKLLSFVGADVVDPSSGAPLMLEAVTGALAAYRRTHEAGGCDADRLTAYMDTLFETATTALSCVSIADASGRVWNPASGAPLPGWNAGLYLIRETAPSPFSISDVRTALERASITDPALRRVLNEARSVSLTSSRP